MSKEEIALWARELGVSKTHIRRELQRERDMERARRDPKNWTVLRYPTGEVYAFPNSFFGCPQQI
jgi:hypothetical protein